MELLILAFKEIVSINFPLALTVSAIVGLFFSFIIIFLSFVLWDINEIYARALLVFMAMWILPVLYAINKARNEIRL